MKRRKFVLKGQIVFEANNIDEAMRMVDRFWDASKDEKTRDDWEFLPGTEIEIVPYRERWA